MPGHIAKRLQVDYSAGIERYQLQHLPWMRA
jgi:hypothetical protein